MKTAPYDRSSTFLAYESEAALVQGQEREKGKIKEEKPKNAKMGTSQREEDMKLRDPTISSVNKWN